MDSFELSTDTYDPKGLRQREHRAPLQPDDYERPELDDIPDAPRSVAPDELPIYRSEEKKTQRPRRRKPDTSATRRRETAAPEQAKPLPSDPDPATDSAPQPNNRSTMAEFARRSVRGSVAAPSVRTFFADGRLAIFLGVVLILFSAYMLVASISYIANASADQSELINTTADILKNRAPEIENTTGWFGAMLSHFLIYRWLGIGSFIIIFYVGAVGLTLVRLCHFKFWPLTFKSLVSAIAVSLIVGLATVKTASSTFWGGEHGYYINTLLIDNASLWSAVAVAVAALTALILIFVKPLAYVFSKLGTVLGHIRDNMARRHEEAIEAAHRTEMRRQAERAAETERIKQQRQTRSGHEAEKPTANTHTFPDAKPEAEPDKVEHGNETFLTDDAVVASPVESTPKPAPLYEIFAPLSPTVDTGSAYDPSKPSSPADTPADSKPLQIETDAARHQSTVELSDLPSSSPTSTPSAIATAAATPIPLTISLDPEVEQTDLTPPTVSDKPKPSAAEAITLELLPVRPDDEIPSDSAATLASEQQEETTDSDLYDPRADLSHYRLPSLELLRDIKDDVATVDEEEQEANKQRIINILLSYGVEISSIRATIGPTITLYEIIPAPGVRISKIKRLGDDVALNLSAMGIRIIAPIPGRGTIGMEVPNKKPRVVSIRSILSSRTYLESKAQLPMALGKTISNEVYVADLAKMPHLLVAGATGMGKSVGLNTIIASLLYRKHPSELKFVLVDPKRVEFSLYKCIERHYLAKLPEEENAIIIDPDKVVATLNSLCVEMENRYALLSEAGMRGIKDYNEKFISRSLNPEKGHRFLPYIVVVIDEFADLILTVGKEVETPISRIAAKARAVGIHIILATQRPSVNVITGVIKANFPGRMAFRVTQRNDSQTILDRPGAEQLIGSGDMLISRDGIIERVQCAFIDTPEVEAICNYIATQQSYPMAYELPEMPTGSDGSAASGLVGDRDPLFAEAGREVIAQGIGSTSSLQRKFNIGYPRAGKIMDQLEASGVVGPTQGGKPRAVLMDMYSFERYLES